MKKTLFLLAGFLAVSVAHGAFTISGDKLPVIVTSVAPTPAEAFTARELQNYLGWMVGSRPEIRSTDQVDAQEIAIIVGDHPANAELMRQLSGQHDSYERFAIQCVGNHLQLAAPHSSGILYAGWEWLEQQGVEWLMPGRNGTFIPEVEVLEVTDKTEFHAPELPFRSCTNYNDSGAEWMRASGGAPIMLDEMENGVNAGWLYAWRSRLNTSNTFDAKDAFTILGSGHSYEVFLPIEQYREAHPEWFGWRDGKRQTRDDAWQICFSSEAAAGEFARNACAAIESALASGIPQDRILLCVSPNDHEAFCQCDSCNARVDEGGFYSSNVLHFANLVADEIHRKYPDVKVTYYVYHSYGRIPTLETPHEGVYAFITAWTAFNSLAVNNAKPLMDAGGNRIFREVFDWFAQNSSGVIVYPYYGHFEIFSAWPMQTQMKVDFQEMAKNRSFMGMNSESHLQWSTQPLNLYLYPKLLWNPAADVAALTKEFCVKAYGPAAADAEAFFAVQQNQMDALSYICGNGVEALEILPASVIAQCDALIAKIRAKMPEMTPPQAWRTQLLIDGWTYSKLYCEAMELLVHGSTPEAQTKILANFNAIYDYLQTDQGRYAFESRVVKMFNLDHYKRSVEVNLQALPAGHTQWGGGMFYGGAVKFYAKCRNTINGLWGFHVQPNSTGEIDWTLKSAAGPIEKLAVDFSGDSAKTKVFVTTAEGRQVEVPLQDGRFTIPKEALGGKTVTLQLRCVNDTKGESHWFFVANLDVEVAQAD